MKRYSALINETWWLWLGLVAAGTIMGSLVNFVFFVTIPICFFSFIYFGLMRYDENGNPVGDGTD